MQDSPEDREHVYHIFHILFVHKQNGCGQAPWNPAPDLKSPSKNLHLTK
jgi:hypothetical protein